MVRDPSVAVARNIMLSRSTLHTLSPLVSLYSQAKGPPDLTQSPATWTWNGPGNKVTGGLHPLP